MKKTAGLILFAAAALMLAGCTDSTSEQDDSAPAVSSTVMQNTGLTTTPTTVTPATLPKGEDSTTEAKPTGTADATGTTTAATDTTTTESTTTTTVRFPAESDEYGESDEPHPLNFTYMFTTEGIGLRMEGGNYQTLHYPMSKDTAGYLAEHYIIQDCNFDGCYDLLLPVQLTASNTTYALYLWDEDKLQFGETPLELVNPRFNAENATVHSRVKGSEVVYTYEIYEWAGTTLQRMAQHIVNTQTHTVTSFLYDDGKIAQHDVKTYADDAKLQAFINGL